MIKVAVHQYIITNIPLLHPVYHYHYAIITSSIPLPLRHYYIQYTITIMPLLHPVYHYHYAIITSSIPLPLCHYYIQYIITNIPLLHPVYHYHYAIITSSIPLPLLHYYIQYTITIITFLILFIPSSYSQLLISLKNWLGKLVLFVGLISLKLKFGLYLMDT